MGKFISSPVRSTVQLRFTAASTIFCSEPSIFLLVSDLELIPKVQSDSHGALSGGTLTLKSNDVKADAKIIVEFGGKILGEADEAWGHMLVFEDPDGNVLKLINPK